MSGRDAASSLRAALGRVGTGLLRAWSRAPTPHAIALNRIERRLAALEASLHRFEHFAQGGNATYLDHGLVLVKVIARGHRLACLMEASDRLITPWLVVSGAYETELTEHFGAVLRPDDHCLDIGANFGYFSLLFGRLCPRGQVIGVEPDARIFALARDNVFLNGLGGTVGVVHAAVLDAAREVTLHRRVGRSANTSIAPPSAAFLEMLGEAPSETFTVPGLPVDVLRDRLGGRIDIMKVDVEGAEPLVLAGAARTIAETPGLQIVMEWSPGQIRAAGFDVGDFLDSLARQGLGFHGIETRPAPPLDRDALLNTEYRAGILLAAHPR